MFDLDSIKAQIDPENQCVLVYIDEDYVNPEDEQELNTARALLSVIFNIFPGTRKTFDWEAGEVELQFSQTYETRYLTQ